MPLILNGWGYSSDRDKEERWQHTLKWAEERGLMDLIPKLKDDDFYSVEHLSTSYPEQHYRPDRYAVREQPLSEAIEAAMEVLRTNWSIIAGDELASVCKPVEFTGQKARRLLVRVNVPFTPAWGSWTKLSPGPERKHFTDFRTRINKAIAPLCVDHVDFDDQTNGG
ncbi:MAG: hypothetical protein ABMA13_00850 [Chthoniobacteraceae bacterium]